MHIKFMNHMHCIYDNVAFSVDLKLMLLIDVAFLDPIDASQKQEIDLLIDAAFLLMLFKSHKRKQGFVTL